jgi:non-ribosomal peptide synthetase component F
VAERTNLSLNDPEQSCAVSERFEAQAAQHPRRTAVHTEGGAWTYNELNGYVCKIAIAIRDSGSTGCVALLFDHGVGMIAAVLAALKAGVAYVPLDATWPIARLKYVLDDTCPSLVLLGNTSTSFLDLLSIRCRSHLILDPTSGTVESRVDDVMPSESDDVKSSGDLAYILYTSGSTGTPKGVMQTRRNVLRHIDNYTASLRIDFSDRMSLLSNCASDAAVMDIFGALLNGASLFPFCPKGPGLQNIDQWVQRNAITIYHSTPTLYRMLVSKVSRRRAEGALRAVVLGGEEVLIRDVDRFKACVPDGGVLINGYGPTECTLAMQQLVCHDSSFGRVSIPLGERPDLR